MHFQLHEYLAKVNCGNRVFFGKLCTFPKIFLLISPPEMRRMAFVEQRVTATGSG